MRIDISIIGTANNAKEKERLVNELAYIDKLLTQSLGFNKIRETFSGTFDTHIIWFDKRIKLNDD